MSGVLRTRYNETVAVKPQMKHWMAARFFRLVANNVVEPSSPHSRDATTITVLSHTTPENEILDC